MDVFAESLRGDGISFAFFHHLWSRNKGQEKKENLEPNSPNVLENQIRLPDTVIFRLGQPLQWYFTSQRGGVVNILKKRKQNINVEKIEEAFLRKAGCKSDKESFPKQKIIAYFIASPDGPNTAKETEDHDWSETCDIEYFDEEGLHQFLFHERKSRNGILQRFIDPSGCGTKNTQIRAICTPTLCVLERRKTKQNLNDTRYGLYERAVTFEGPEMYSTSLPIHGKALPTKLRNCCKKVLDDVACTISNRSRKAEYKGDIRMVLNLKIDSKDRVWILYSSSIRSITPKSSLLPDLQSSNIDEISSATLNIQDVVSFSSSIKLNENPNHDPNRSISNRRGYKDCPSCGKSCDSDNFHPVPFKTIISHFERVISLSDNIWPPSSNLIQNAGGVGFGTIDEKTKGSLEEARLIPPVIRYLHDNMKVGGYRRYRTDPLFLHRQCEMCESCFLSYANLSSTSFQITQPIAVDNDLTFAKRLDCREEVNNTKRETKLPRNKYTKLDEKKKGNLFRNLEVKVQTQSEVVLATENDHDASTFMPLSYDQIESYNNPLLHLLKKDVTKTKAKKEAVNPYLVPMSFVQPSSNHRKKERKNKEDSGQNVNVKDNLSSGKNFELTPEDVKLVQQITAQLQSTPEPGAIFEILGEIDDVIEVGKLLFKVDTGAEAPEGGDATPPPPYAKPTPPLPPVQTPVQTPVQYGNSPWTTH